jgi:hypothetical protein
MGLPFPEDCLGKILLLLPFKKQVQYASNLYFPYLGELSATKLLFCAFWNASFPNLTTVRNRWTDSRSPLSRFSMDLYGAKCLK